MRSKHYRWFFMLLLAPWPGLAACEAPSTNGGEAPEEAPPESTGVVLLEADIPSTGTVEIERPRFASDEFGERRELLVRRTIENRGIKDAAVVRAMKRVPRHEFIPTSARGRAYDDSPVPIGHGQTISQPYIVAFMTEMLQIESGSRVLEIGTGSGYQAAILAEIAREVVSIEIIDELARSAADRFRRLGYKNVTVISGDGYFGWKDQAPFDAIIVTAAAEHVPPPLVKQLKPGGRMAIPVGRTGWTQNLLLIEKDEQGSVKTRSVLPVRFVPLTRRRR